ncbi:MAG: transketolase [Actinobacteria bacterium]|nr:transketolase [Actinomycetota bacterium]MCL5447384.1 transketolase [Actinomycetota bacterium]
MDPHDRAENASPHTSSLDSHSNDRSVEDLGVAVIRGLAMDMPQRAHSGHPGTAMALAPLAHVLFTRILKHDPTDPKWPDRDRFVLSCGHASVLLYSMLYLTGYGLTIDDLKRFRQIGSITPGHPESDLTPGVEVTTGPLGQGIGTSVGMAIAERSLRSKMGDDLVNHYTYVICSDGDLMEGISHEAASLAGHQQLGHLVCIYDDNHITIDGSTDLAYSDNVALRFQSYGWHVMALGEIAEDRDALEAALRVAKEDERPSMLILRSHIGWPAPHKHDTSSAHGEPLGIDEVRDTKEILGLPPDKEMFVPDEVLQFYRRSVGANTRQRIAWESQIAAQSSETQDLWRVLQQGIPDASWRGSLPTFEEGAKMATRVALKACINATLPFLPGLMAGSADLTGNTGVALDDATEVSAQKPSGRQMHFGIREHAMGAAMLGAARHGGVLPVGGTFFVFSDYMKPSVRLAALTQSHVIYSWTHDSIGLGEDGPTHQPVEHLAALRAVPGLILIRPADANECSQAWRIAVEHDGPVGLILSRQALEVLPGTANPLAGTSSDIESGVARGAYVLAGGTGTEPDDIILVASGSEVATCMHARDLLAEQNVAARVVSFPSWELFEDQDASYRSQVLPSSTPKLAVEAASTLGWDRYTDAVFGMTTFGASGPGDEVMAHFGFTPHNIAGKAVELLSGTYS